MVVNRKVSGTASSIPAGVVIGAGCGVMVSILGALIFSKLIDGELLPESSIGFAAMGILLASSFLGAWITAAKIKRRKLMGCALCGVVFYGILLAMTALFFGGQYQGMGVTALLVAAGSGCAALLDASRKPKGSAHGRRKLRK